MKTYSSFRAAALMLLLLGGWAVLARATGSFNIGTGGGTGVVLRVMNVDDKAKATEELIAEVYETGAVRVTDGYECKDALRAIAKKRVTRIEAPPAPLAKDDFGNTCQSWSMMCQTTLPYPHGETTCRCSTINIDVGGDTGVLIMDDGSSVLRVHP